MIYTRSINVDFIKSTVNDVIHLHEGDVNGSGLTINVFNNGIAYDLTGCSVKYDAVIGGYIAECDTIASANGNTITVPITKNMTAVNGKLRIDVKIIKNADTLFFQTFEAEVQRRVIRGDEQIDLDGTTIGQKLEFLDELIQNPPEKRSEVFGDDLDHADRNDTLYIHKVGSRVKGIVFVAGDVPPYQGCTQYRLRKSGSVEYRFGALNLTTDPYSYDWGGYSATGDWKRLATLDDIPDIPEAVNPWKNKRYLSHGDSITWYDGHGYLWGEHKGEIATGYQTIMKELLGLSYNRATDNKGRSGYTIAHNYEGSHDGSDNLVDVIADVNIDYTAYDLCTILGGTNDYRRATPLGELGQTGDDYESLDTDTFYGAYRKCVEYILTAAPDIRLVLITPFQRDPYPAWSSYEATYDGNKPNAEGLKLIDYVNAVKLIGKMYGLPVCDLYSNSGITELTLGTYTIDGLHPNDDGYKRIGEVLANTLTSGGNNDAADLSGIMHTPIIVSSPSESDAFPKDQLFHYMGGLYIKTAPSGQSGYRSFSFYDDVERALSYKENKIIYQRPYFRKPVTYPNLSVWCDNDVIFILLDNGTSGGSDYPRYLRIGQKTHYDSFDPTASETNVETVPTFYAGDKWVKYSNIDITKQESALEQKVYICTRVTSEENADHTWNYSYTWKPFPIGADSIATYGITDAYTKTEINSMIGDIGTRLDQVRGVSNE